MKAGQFMSYCKRKSFIKKHYKKCVIFLYIKDLIQPLLENEVFEIRRLYCICKNETIKICQNQHADFLKFLFTEDSLKNKKIPGTKNFSFVL